MTKYFCDKCGGEIKGILKHIRYDFNSRNNYWTEIKSLELCIHCFDSIVSILESKYETKSE